MPPPSPAPMESLNPAQRSAFLRVWAQFPSHLREIAFDLHDPRWDPPAIEQLGDVLYDFPNVFSTSKTDFGSCSLMPFVISVPEGSAPVTSRPHRINPKMAKEVDGTLNQYLWVDSALDLTVLEPAGGHPEEIWQCEDHGELQGAQPNSQAQPTADSPRGPGPGLLRLRSGVFLFVLVFSFHQITGHKDTVPLTAFCTPTGLYEWLVMPQGSSASPGWFVKVINEVIKG